MLITKEQQEAWLNAYVKEKHSTDECIGFIDGINKTLEAIAQATQSMQTFATQEKQGWMKTLADKYENEITQQQKDMGGADQEGKIWMQGQIDAFRELLKDLSELQKTEV